MTIYDDLKREVEERLKHERAGWERIQKKSYSEKEYDKAKNFIKNYLIPRLTVATKYEYLNWLLGWSERGNKATHVYDYSFVDAGLMIATQDFGLMALSGAQAKSIIVPKGIKFLGNLYGDDGIGRCNLYFEDGYRLMGTWVPAYKDLFSESNIKVKGVTNASHI